MQSEARTAEREKKGSSFTKWADADIAALAVEGRACGCCIYRWMRATLSFAGKYYKYLL